MNTNYKCEKINNFYSRITHPDGIILYNGYKIGISKEDGNHTKKEIYEMSKAEY